MKRLKRPLLHGFCAFLTGEVLAHDPKLGVAAGILFLVIFREERIPLFKNNKRQYCRRLAVLSFFALVGFCCFLSAKREPSFDKVFEAEKAIKLDVQISGKVESMEQRVNAANSVNQARILLKECRIRFDGKTYAEGIQKVLVLQQELPDCIEGDFVILSGSLREISSGTNSGEYDQKTYYLARNISYLMYGKAWEITKSASAFSHLVRAFPRRVRVFLEEGITKVLGKDSGLFLAITLGEKWAVSEETLELFQESGIGHILSVSGLHLSLLCMGLYRVLRRRLHVRYVTSTVICSVMAVFYLLLTGNGIGTARAVFMFCMFLAGELLGRQYDMASAASLAGVLLLVRSPLLLLDAGFQLSFSAIFAIALLVPVLTEKELGKIPNRMMPGIALFLGTLPVMAAHFFQVSVVSLFLNFLLLPVFPILVLSGCAAGVLGTVLPKILFYVLQPAVYILKGYQIAASWSTSLPFSIWRMGKPAVWQLLLYGMLLWLFAKKKKLLLFLLPICLLHIPLPFLTVSYLDVGQGDSCFVRTADGTTLLIDGGSSDKKEIGKNILIPFLKSKSVRKLDYVFVSHGDEDHVNGIGDLIEADMVRAVVLPKGQWEKQELLMKLRDQALEKGVKVYEFGQGEEIMLGNTRIRCLWPGKEADALSENEASMVLWISYFRLNMLFMGDLEGRGEEGVTALLKTYGNELPEQFDLLKVSHHGSKNATYESFLDIVHPKTSIISCGRFNQYGHPAKETLERLEKQKTVIYKTFEKYEIDYTFLVTNEKTYAILPSR